jgi:hypothetical protein
VCPEVFTSQAAFPFDSISHVPAAAESSAFSSYTLKDIAAVMIDVPKVFTARSQKLVAPHAGK